MDRAELKNSGGERPRAGVLLAAALMVVTVAYSNSLQGPFVWDDRELIERGELPKVLAPAAHLARSFWHQTAATDADPTYFRPLTTFTYAIDWHLWDGHPAGFHLTNLILHLVVVALVFLLARRSGAPALAAALAAALFGCFPRLTESVTWISGRTDLLATALGLAAILAHGDGAKRLGRRVVAAGLILLGLMAKEVAAGAMLGIVIVEVVAVWRGEKRLRAALCDTVPVILAGALYAVLRTTFLRGVEPPKLNPYDHRIWMPLQALGEYVFMVVDPRPRLQIGLLGELEPWSIATGLVAALGLGLGGLRLVRRPPPPDIAGLLAAAATGVALVLHIVTIRVNVVAADRFLYLPLACLASVLASSAASLPLRFRRGATLACLLALSLYLPLTLSRNEDWADEVRLWQVAVGNSSPKDYLPVNELGNALTRAGRHSEGLQAYQRAYEIIAAEGHGQAAASALSNVATALSNLGRFQEARERMLEAIRLEPERPVNYFNLAVVETRLQLFDEAERGLDEALRRLPDYPEAARARALLTKVRHSARSLPPEQDDEATPVLVQRARLWTQLAVAPRAEQLWVRVVHRADAGLAEVEEAAAFLLVAGKKNEAKRAVARAVELGTPPERRRALEAGLRENQSR